MNETLLTIKDLSVTVHDGSEKKILLNRICLDVPSLSIVGLVGGSGSGKTTTGLAVLKLLSPALKIDDGEIIFQNENLLKIALSKLQQIRGKAISMIFQEPLQAFNPVFTIGYQIEEVLVVHTTLNAKQRKEKILSLLDKVGIKDPKRVAGNYPHQLSGGMRQRAMIAQAIAVDPRLIIADEPTSNLDVTLQARIMELFLQLRDELKLTLLLITHDLGMVSHISDRVAVMNQGQIVEQGITKEVIENPQQEYTKKLLGNIKF
ncbi:MAG: ABC transporter ATP-binding protein [Candidatus Omnitrophica bacterium]|nr:ABC transporter ATP-binding protein [Candidatus Omnitrophota bacterium]